MKPQLLKVNSQPEYSFNVRQDMLPNVNNNWHYHPEIELIHFHRGRGTQFVGDNMKRFSAGDMVLVGKNLPHYWKYDEDTTPADETNNGPYSTVIHFYDNFWSDQFLNLPENRCIKQVLEAAGRGLQIHGETAERVACIMEKLVHSHGPMRILLLIEALIEISGNEKAWLSSAGFRPVFDEADKARINLIYAYSFAHFREKIALDTIADVASVRPQSFCRYFKSKTSKTYSQFINELRIGYACKLLMENRISVKQICFESGFNNFSSFHTCFKNITGKSPLNYRLGIAG
ncbi:AraC family transcriptional regulator [Mucilaginibacter gynuensis]|uniref:AraC family transcriptional regulator n=1 Tax=Mucilaginibacter gynuensis TaxID=1302236 RepID=A0ABP8G3H6_9SPHI